MSTDLVDYYRRRAREYDLVYEKPERQDDISTMSELVATLLTGRNVLEVAAGTGFWTACYADVASSVAATDVNDAVLEVARQRRTWPTDVAFGCADCFALEKVTGRFDAGFVGFLWSHLPLRDLDRFLLGLTARLEPGALVVILDNRYVEGSSHPITRRDDEGNTYQRRTLADGSEWEVMKNFPTVEQLHQHLELHRTEVLVRELDYYWIATFRT